MTILKHVKGYVLALIVVSLSVLVLFEKKHQDKRFGKILEWAGGFVLAPVFLLGTAYVLLRK